MRRICVFCGSSVGASPAYADAARAMGLALVARGCSLVYGGGHVGLMGILADAVLGSGRRGDRRDSARAQRARDRAIALDDPARRRLDARAQGDDGGDVGRVRRHARRLRHYEEIFEAVTWTQLGVHKKPCGLLNVAGFYNPIVSFLDHAVREQFILSEHRSTVLADADPARLLDELAMVVLPDVPKWIGLAEA